MWWSRFLTTGTLFVVIACSAAPATRAPARAPAPDPEPPLAPLTIAPRVVIDTEPTPAALADARHLLNRCSFGPRPGEVERVARMGPERWLDEQLAGPPESPLLEAALVPYRSAFAPPAQLVAEWLGEGWEAETRNISELRSEAKTKYREHAQYLVTAEVTRSILSRRQLEAVMTSFWSNHFNVYIGKGYVRLYQGDYLERAIRPNALGKFSELLLATARHPAMLMYLDNDASQKERAGNSRGLNENYARELLELHTLGVDGGYTQSDVRDVARILTGWSVVTISGGRFEFLFRKGGHDRGAKTVLGEQFPAGGLEEEGVRLLELLARHPSTARHLAKRLCVRFVADEPPAGCVDAASRAYARSDGDIREVVSAILKHPSFWAPSARGGKLKTPLELLTSAARAFEALPDGGSGLSSTLEKLGESLLHESVPTGYPDSESDWSSSGGMLARLSFATDLAQDRVSGLQVPWNEALPTGLDGAELVNRLGARLLGMPPESRTLALVREEVRGIMDPRQRRVAAVALLVGSPEFQRQ